MNYPEEPKPEKPISEKQYRIIALILFFIAFFASVFVVFEHMQPARFIFGLIGSHDEDSGWVAWLFSFLFFIIIDAIILRLIRPYSNVPKSPYSNLNVTSFFKGENDQDEYKINDKN